MEKVKSLINNITTPLGFKVERVKKNAVRNSLYESYLHLGKLGFQPKTVLDIGIAKGTPELYLAFPDAYFLLVEPLKEFEDTMKNILKKYKGEYVLAAAGKKNSEVEFNVHTNHLSGSSLYKEEMGEAADGELRKIKLLKLDDVVAEKNLKGPFLLKVDVQGAELDVLDGCTAVLKDTEAISLEVSLFKFMKNAPDFYEVVDYMKQRGFVAYDIELAWNRPLDNALGQLNMIFVKEDGQFRKSHAYAKVNQLDNLF